MTAFKNIPGLPPGLSLNGTEFMWMVQQGVDVRISAAQLLAFIQAVGGGGSGGGSATTYPSRVVLDNPGAVMLLTDVALFINKSVAGPTTVALIPPSLGRIAIVRDMKGDAGTNNITIDAGAGNLIDDQVPAQTLVMNVNKEATMLLGESTTQWGIIL